MHRDFAVAVEMLPAPKTVDLTEEQLDGDRCVWCRNRAKVDLGPRLRVIDNKLWPWHPRSCRRCVKREASAAFRDHIQTCARCTPQVYCVDARALHDLSGLLPWAEGPRGGKSGRLAPA